MVLRWKKIKNNPPQVIQNENLVLQKSYFWNVSPFYSYPFILNDDCFCFRKRNISGIRFSKCTINKIQVKKFMQKIITLKLIFFIFYWYFRSQRIWIRAIFCFYNEFYIPPFPSATFICFHFSYKSWTFKFLKIKYDPIYHLFEYKTTKTKDHSRRYILLTF